MTNNGQKDPQAVAAALLAGKRSGRSARPANRTYEPSHLANHPGVAEIGGMLDLAEANNMPGAGYFIPQRKAGHGRAVTADGRTLVNYSSYDYLGLGDNPDLKRAGIQALEHYGVSLSATRSVGGHIDLYDVLEQEISETYGTEDAVLFTSGYLTNVAFLSYVLSTEDVVIHDELVHNSMIAGVEMSKARRLSFRHNNLEHLEEQLRRHRRSGRTCLVMAEGIYSMDGDIGPIPEILELVRRYDADLYVDEAHSFGVLGPHGHGVLDHFGLTPSSDLVLMNTVSKALASVGGYVTGDAGLMQALKYLAPGAILYCAPMPASQAAATLMSLRILKQRPDLPEMARQKAHLFRTELQNLGLDTGLSEFGTAVVPVITRNSVAAIRMSHLLRQRNIIAFGLFHPVVPEDAARVRFFVSAAHTAEDLSATARIVAEVAQQVGVAPTT